MNARIKNVRKKLNLTQVKFAERVGITQNYLTRVETGERTPSDQLILSICREYGVNELWLRTGEGEMFAPVSKEEEIADFIGGLLAGGSESFKRRFVSALAQLPEEAWEAVEAFCRKVLEESDE